MRAPAPLLALLALSCARPARVLPAAAHHAPAPTRALWQWQRGQTHVHTDRSGDSRTPPDDAVRWYAEHGFDFIVLTDHNVLTRPRPSPRPGMLVFAGSELTWNARDCGPPDAPCNLHVNALFAAPPPDDTPLTLAPADPADRASVYASELALAARLGGLAQLNHPNFRYGAGAPLLAQLARSGLRLVEFANASDGCQNEGDATHVDTEALWDRVLDQGLDVWNVASDDAHHYYDAAQTRARGEPAYTGGLGWVMVRAALEGRALREALWRGEFYSSTGPRLEALSGEGDALALTVAGSEPGVRVRFVAEPGRVVHAAQGRAASLRYDAVPADAHWLRAVVDDASGHHAWTQPVRLSREGGRVRARGPFTDSPVR